MTEAIEEALPNGYQMENFEIIRLLGRGGFGLTYLARDKHLNILVAIKEYLPVNWAKRGPGHSVFPSSPKYQKTFAWGRQRFLEEARILARFPHPSIVRIRHFFTAHHTAYFVMDYEEGQSLEQAVADDTRPSESDLLRIVLPLLDGLGVIHHASLLHRDIKPDNIYLRTRDRSAVLLDFGAARFAMSERSNALTEIIAAGYSPPEQYYSQGNQGPWSDLYALGAVMYRCVSGEIPPESMSRFAAVNKNRPDPMPSALEASRGHYSRPVLQAIDWALRVDEEQRPQSALALREALSGESKPPGLGKFRPKPRPKKPVKEKKAEEPIGGGLLAGVLLLIGVVIGGAGVGIWVTREGPEEPARVLPQEGDVFRDSLQSGGQGPPMVVIPGGSFMMGSPSDEAGRDDDEGPRHEVRVDRFAMGKYEVTNEQYVAFLNAVGHRGTSERPWFETEQEDSDSKITGGVGNFRVKSGYGHHPVVEVSWYGAVAYTQWLSRETGKNYRLPTEAEWEYAARGGRQTRYWWGNQKPVCRQGARNGANFNGCEGRGTKTVGFSQANPYGLYDVHGNVWEWTCSAYSGSYDGNETICKNNANRYVLRGGSWLDNARYLRAANRGRNSPDVRNNNLGLRVVVSF